MGNDAQSQDTRSHGAQSHTVDAPTVPRGELSLRTLAMPADTNQNGDIFGGWLLSQMDIAGGIFVGKSFRCAA